MVLKRHLKDRYARWAMRSITYAAGLLVFVVAFVLFVKSIPLLESHSIVELLLSSSWYPMRGEFGFFPFIFGTLMVTGLAMLFAVPVCILSAIYLSEYASKRVRSVVKPLIDLLAGIPSVVYGLWGVLFVVPLIRNRIAPLAGVTTTGYNVLAGSIVLSIMVSPIVISVTEEVLRSIPFEIRETSLALGATKWQTVKHAVMKRASTGVFAAVILGFGRAFGETMAVIMVVGNTAKVSTSVFDAAYPLPALIANNYGEMMSLPMYDSALMFAALILLLVIGAFNVLAYMIRVRFIGGIR
jgi:phosphate transport system permease protein